MIIAVEGVDGVGKSHAVKLIADNWWGKKELWVSKEPFMANFDELLASVMKQVPKDAHAKLVPLFMYLLDREVHTAHIRKAIAENKDVLLDRCYFSTLVYQDVIRKSDNRKLNAMVMGHYKPNLVVLLLDDVSQIQKRQQERDGTGMEVEEIEKLQDKYIDVAKNSDRHHVVVIFDKRNYDEKEVDKVFLDVVKSAFYQVVSGKLRNGIYNSERFLKRG